MTNEGQSIRVDFSVGALVSRRAARLGHKADLLVVADRLHLAARTPSQIAH